MSIRVGVIDYSISNLASVINAFRHLGVAVDRVSDARYLDDYTHLVLPGVGSFARGMTNLHRAGLIHAIRQQALAGKPLLGLCLGMQLFAEAGDEYGPSEGLGLLAGRVARIDTAGTGLRLPHVGWNDVVAQRESRLLASIPEPATFYFLHSYAYDNPEARYVSGVAHYAQSLVAVVEQGNLFGVQFHPEKSQSHGMQLLKNFVSIAMMEASC